MPACAPGMAQPGLSSRGRAIKPGKRPTRWEKTKKQNRTFCDPGARQSGRGSNTPALKDNVMADTIIKTLRLKIKTSAYDWLNAAAREVNQIWNFANQASMDAADRGRRTQTARLLSGFDLCYLTAGTTEFTDHIGADTIQRVCVEYATKRKAAKKFRLNWRKSGGSRKSRGWVPFKAASIKRKGAGLRFCGKSIRVFELDRLEGVKWKDGCFAQDACGDWFLSLPVECSIQPGQQFGEVGIDLGLKDTAVTSDGEVLVAGQFYRGIEPQIAHAQRRAHKKQAKRLHRRAANRRKDALHKFTTGIVQRYSRIFVGDVSAPKLAKTRMAKSVLDAGWGMLRTQLMYKCQRAGAEFAIVNERNTTRACSNCGCISGPSGLKQLVVRSWICEGCGAAHERDINAATNILIRGRNAPPFAGTLFAHEEAARTAVVA